VSDHIALIAKFLAAFLTFTMIVIYWRKESRDTILFNQQQAAKLEKFHKMSDKLDSIDD